MQNKNPFIRQTPQNNFTPQQNSGNNIMSFIQEYGNNPQKAQQEVMQLLQNGQMSQAQFDSFKNQVPQIMQMFGFK